MTDISKTSFKDYIMIHEAVTEEIESLHEKMVERNRGSEALEESFTVKDSKGKVVHTAYSENAARAKAIELSKSGEKHTSGFDREAMVKENNDLEEAAFDWGKTKPDTSWLTGKGKKSDTTRTSGGLTNKGTYGSEDHRAPNTVNTPKEKQSVGRPAGAYGAAYKIDKGARDSQEYKDALSAKVRAAKAQGFEDRTYFKDLMNASLLNHAKFLAKKAEDEAKNK